MFRHGVIVSATKNSRVSSHSRWNLRVIFSSEKSRRGDESPGQNTKTVAAAKISYCLIRRIERSSADVFPKVLLTSSSESRDSIVYASTLDNHRYVTSEKARKNIICIPNASKDFFYPEWWIVFCWFSRFAVAKKKFCHSFKKASHKGAKSMETLSQKEDCVPGISFPLPLKP